MDVSAIVLTQWPRRSDMLQQALESLVWQDFGGTVEAVVVNDGAPIRPLVPGVRVVNLTRRMSTGAKRNVGFDVAAGDFVATWDDDDVSLPERLRILFAEGMRGASFVHPEGLYVTDGDLRLLAWIRSVAMPAMLARRKDVLRVGGCPDQDRAEDWELYLRMRGAGMRCVRVPCVGYCYRRHGSNVTTDHTLEKLLRDRTDRDVRPAQTWLDELRTRHAGRAFLERA